MTISECSVEVTTTSTQIGKLVWHLHLFYIIISSIAQSVGLFIAAVIGGCAGVLLMCLVVTIISCYYCYQKNKKGQNVTHKVVMTTHVQLREGRERNTRCTLIISMLIQIGTNPQMIKCCVYDSVPYRHKTGYKSSTVRTASTILVRLIMAGCCVHDDNY